MLNGRLYDTEDMSQIAPNRVERKPFFFKKDGGDTIHPETESRLEALESRFHWVH